MLHELQARAEALQARSCAPTHSRRARVLKYLGAAPRPPESSSLPISKARSGCAGRALQREKAEREAAEAAVRSARSDGVAAAAKAAEEKREQACSA
jgi:hypothetical protein